METILIVEDDPTMLRGLKDNFEFKGYRVLTAADGEEGLNAALNEKPDLITLDLEMPGEWGPRLYRKMSKVPDVKDIPVIVISGMSGKHAIKKAIAYLAKPFDPDQLLATVKKTIG